MHCCYMLKNAAGLTYLGATSDISRRLRQHNSTTTKKRSYTFGKGPWTLFAKEVFSTRAEAFAMEKRLKANAKDKMHWITANKI